MFDELITEDWEAYFSEEWDETRRFEVANLFARIQPATILDVGCGCGFHDLEMARYPFVQIVDAIDYSERSIERANQTYPHAKVRRRVADLSTDQPDRRYDLVVSFQVFEHLDRPDAYFRLCRLACAERGHIAVFTPNRARLRNAIRGLKGLEPELSDPQHFKEYTVADLRALAESEGFSFASSFGYGLNGLAWIDRLPVSTRLRFGQLLPWIANGFGILMAYPISRVGSPNPAA